MSQARGTSAPPKYLAIACLSVFSFLACQAAHRSTAEMTIVEAQEALTDSMMALPGVTGTGIGEYNGKPCITVMVERKTADLENQIPKTFQGFPVVVEETGEISAQDESES